jgi:hypothetical protein
MHRRSGAGVARSYYIYNRANSCRETVASTVKGLEVTEWETLIRLIGPRCCDEFSEFAITILKLGLFRSTLTPLASQQAVAPFGLRLHCSLPQLFPELWLQRFNFASPTSD